MSISGDIKLKKKNSPGKSKTSATKTKLATKIPSHPPFAEIIKECIANTKDRSGVSRPTIKKFIEERYNMEVTPTVISNINRCIASGAEKGVFVLPKGPSGKVKLAPKKTSSDAAKEPTKVNAPTKAEKATKPKAAAVKPAPLKAKTPAKTSLPKVKKATSAVAKPPKKKSSKNAPSAKKVLTGEAKNKPPKAKANAKTQKAASAGGKSKPASRTRNTKSASEK